MNGIKSFKDFADIMMNGVYVGVRVDNEELLTEIQKEVLPSSSTPHDDFHVTLIYSKGRGKLPFTCPNRQHTATIIGFDVFGPEQDCLVLKLDCPSLQERHDDLKAQGLTHTYEEYQPHITLSYNFKGKVPDISKWFMTKVYLSGEYFTPIRTDYVP